MTAEHHWVKVASTGDLQAGTGYESEVEIGGDAVNVFQIDGDYFALGSCTHEQGPLSQGIIATGTVACPWHAATFDIRTGGCLSGPTACRVDGSVLDRDSAQDQERLSDCPTFETKVEHGSIYIKVKGSPPRVE